MYGRLAGPVTEGDKSLNTRRLALQLPSAQPPNEHPVLGVNLSYSGLYGHNRNLCVAWLQSPCRQDHTRSRQLVMTMSASKLAVSQHWEADRGSPGQAEEPEVPSRHLNT